MPLHHPESRIAIVFVLLALIVQLAGLYVIHSDTNDIARATASDQLDTGKKLFTHLLVQQTKNSTQNTQIFAADRSLQLAIETQNSDAITTSLTQYQTNSGAVLTALIKLDHQMQLVAPSPTTLKLERVILPLIADADQTGYATAITSLDSQLVQIIAVPIKAPQMLGWMVTGFPIAQNLTAAMNRLSPLQVSVLSHNAQDNWVADATNLNEARTAELIAQLKTINDETAVTSTVQLGQTQFNTHIFRLAQDAEQTSIVVLQRAPADISAPYQRLQLILLFLVLTGISLIVLGGLWIVRRIAVPLRQLTESARRLGNGEYYHDQIELMRDDEIGELSRAFGNMRDGIANRELEIRHLAYWDNLTNLPNRVQFVSLLDQALERARKNHTSCHVLMMDLDRFKQVNDVLGHTLGDALLQQVAQRLLAMDLKSTDQVARLGGDEFALLLPDSRLDEAQAIAAHILTILEQPIALDDQTIDLGASIGIAGFPMHANDAETLLRHVDVAMYVAKAGGNEAVVYDPA
ncbi:MAG: diguanylate cyclase, partial [Herbaspirillum sp.]